MADVTRKQFTLHETGSTSVAETLVAVPQAKDLEPLLGALVAAGYEPRKLTLGRLECHLRLLFAVGGHGKTQLAVRTQHLIDQRTDFQVVICAGAAGSLGGDLALGDVVVGMSTIEHDYKLRFVRRPLPSYQADVHLLAEFRLAASQIDQEFRVLFGAIASGPMRARSRALTHCFRIGSSSVLQTHRTDGQRTSNPARKKVLAGSRGKPP